MQRLSTWCGVILVTIACALSFASEDLGPEAMSPGALGRVTGVESQCPTFSWQAVPGAAGYELVVYELPPGIAPVAAEVLRDAQKVLLLDLAKEVLSWTPTLESGLARGADHMWCVRALFDGENLDVRTESPWSVPRYFRVDTAPTLAEVREAMRVLAAYMESEGDLEIGGGAGAVTDGSNEAESPRIDGDVGTRRAGKFAKDVGTAAAAVRGEMPDASGETYGVVGVSNSAEGAGLGAINTAGGADLVLDGVLDSQTDAAISQSGIDRASTSAETFDFTNSGGGGMTLRVNGVGVVTTLTDQDTVGGLSCSAWQVAKWDGSQWVCRQDWDTLYNLSCAGDEIAKWNGANWVCAEDDHGTAFESTHVVSPVGNSLQNGTALLATVSALSWSTVYVEPGTYDLGSVSLPLLSGVQLIGVWDRTTIRSSVCDYPVLKDPTAATIILGPSAGLRDLTVTNTCPDPGATAIAVLNPAGTSGTTIDNVYMRASADANTCIGLYSGHSMSVVRGNGFANCDGGDDYGILIEGPEPGGGWLTDCSAVSTNGGVALSIAAPNWVVRRGYAVAVSPGTGLEVAADDVLIQGTRAEGSVASISFTSGQRVKITDAVGWGDIVIDGSQTQVVVNGWTQDTRFGTWDIDVTGGATAEVMNVMLQDINVGSGSVKVGGSRIVDVIVGTGGTAKCAGVWDWNYTFFPSTCP